MGYKSEDAEYGKVWVEVMERGLRIKVYSEEYICILSLCFIGIIILELLMLKG